MVSRWESLIYRSLTKQTKYTKHSTEWCKNYLKCLLFYQQSAAVYEHYSVTTHNYQQQHSTSNLRVNASPGRGEIFIIIHSRPPQILQHPYRVEEWITSTLTWMLGRAKKIEEEIFNTNFMILQHVQEMCQNYDGVVRQNEWEKGGIDNNALCIIFF